MKRETSASRKNPSSQSDSSDHMAAMGFTQITQDMIHKIPLGVVVFDSDLHIVTINPVARQWLDGAADIIQALEKRADPQQNYTWRQQVQQSLADGTPHVFENVTFSQNGPRQFLQIICTPLGLDENKKPLGGILVLEDTTAKVMMQKDLAFSERLAALGKLSARVAHELNNPLDGILRYINLALRVADQNQQEQIGRYLEESQKGLKRMVRIVGGLLEFSRSTYSAFEETDINKIVDDAVKTMEAAALEKKIHIQCRYTKNMPKIRAGNLFQVFLNLVKNAIDAIQHEGSLTIQTHCDEYNALISFTDTGTGLNEKVKESLFEPFFTTKEPGKGTGLGLAVCRDIIERYDGKITAENVPPPQHGAVFTVSIPLQRTMN